MFCCCFTYLRFVLAFAELPCAQIIFCFSCKRSPNCSMNWISLWKGVIVKCISHSLWRWKIFSIENLNTLWRIRWHGDQNWQDEHYKYDMKNKITTLKNLIEMRQMTLNDLKFDIKKSLDNLCKLFFHW